MVFQKKSEQLSEIKDAMDVRETKETRQVIETSDLFEVVKIPTETQEVIHNNKDDSYYTVLTALCKIMNDQAAIKHHLVG